MPKADYPFVPKSTNLLERGQFWAIPLSDGSYGAGCVVGKHIKNGKPSSRAFLAGVIGWHGKESPTAEDLFGREVFKFAFAHIKVITESGGEILGKARLKLDKLPESAESLSVSTWGYNVPVLLAHKYAGIKPKRS